MLPQQTTSWYEIGMNDIGAAVIGAGFIGKIHVEALKRLGVPITGVLGSNPEKSELLRQELALGKAYQNYDEVLADESVQVVHLAVPNVLHFDMAQQALKAGKHVMCEKPLAMNAEETSQLVALAKETGLAAGVCFNTRFYPLNFEANSIVHRGDLGKVFSIVGSYQQDWLLYETDYNWRVLAEHSGPMRVVADIGSHWIDLVCFITGLKVEAVCADLQTIHPVRKRPVGEVETFAGKQASDQGYEDIDIDTEDTGGILFRFEGGARGVLWVSQMTAGRKNSLRYEISGTQSALAWDSETPNELWIGHRSRSNERLIRDPSMMAENASRFADYPGGHNEGFPDTFKQCFRAFYDAINSGDPANHLYPTFEDGHHEVALGDAILQSHREQAWVSLK